MLITSKQIVYWTNQNWLHYKRYQEGTSNPLISGTLWSVPKSFDIGPWRQFRKESDENEYLVIIWNQVLTISASAIAEALQASEGTIRYRISNGLKQLGTATLGGFRA